MTIPLPSSQVRRWIDEKTVHEITGLALPTLRNHRHQRKGIPFYKVGTRMIRYRIDDVIAFMEAGRVEPRDGGGGA